MAQIWGCCNTMQKSSVQKYSWTSRLGVCLLVHLFCFFFSTEKLFSFTVVLSSLDVLIMEIFWLFLGLKYLLVSYICLGVVPGRTGVQAGKAAATVRPERWQKEEWWEQPSQDCYTRREQYWPWGVGGIITLFLFQGGSINTHISHHTRAQLY